MGDKLKKFFQLLGLTSLICFSFFYTEKVGYVVREMDSLMEEIKEKGISNRVEIHNEKDEFDKVNIVFNSMNRTSCIT